MRTTLIELTLLKPQSESDANHPTFLAGPWGAGPWLHQNLFKTGYTETEEQLLFSDKGYIDENNRVFAPFVIKGATLFRSLTLSAESASNSYGIGSFDIANPAKILDKLLINAVNDHLPIRISTIKKTWENARGMWLDKSFKESLTLFKGLMTDWQTGFDNASIPVIDMTYWLDSTLNLDTWGGTGKLDGEESLKGRQVPVLRGYASNIQPVLIDSVNKVYQISNAEANVINIYEGGTENKIKFNGFVDDIYLNSPEPGTYVIKKSNNGTWIRLGTNPVYQITLDAFGKFPSGAANGKILEILQLLLLEDLRLSKEFLYPQFMDTLEEVNFDGGWYWDGSKSLTAREMVNNLLSGLGISLISTRDGFLKPYLLRAPSAKKTPEISLTEEVIISISSIALDPSLSPPTWRWRVGFAYNFSVQKSNLSPACSDVRKNILSQEQKIATSLDQEVKEKFRIPNDPQPLVTALKNEQDAFKTAKNHLTIWGARRRLWGVELPQDILGKIDLGDTVFLKAPLPSLRNGANGVVVSEQISTDSNTFSINILV